MRIPSKDADRRDRKDIRGERLDEILRSATHPTHIVQKCKAAPIGGGSKLNPLVATLRGSVGRIEDILRRLDDLSPLVPIDDGMTDEERERAWAAWESEWESVPAADVGVTAAGTLAAARADGERAAAPAWP